MITLGSTLAGKSGPSIQTVINGSTITKTQGCYLSEIDSKFYSVDSNTNVITQKTATGIIFKFYTGVAEDAELPATPSSEMILNASDFIVNSAGSQILQATTLGGGGGGSSTYADGTASAPSINFANETKSGFYRINTNEVGFSINETLRHRFRITDLTFWADNAGSTNFGQFNILGLTNNLKYCTAGFNTTADYGMIEAGLDGTGYYDVVLNRNNSSNVLIGTTTNSYSTRFFVNGTVGVSGGLILNDGSAGTPALRFETGPTNGLYYESSELKFAIGGRQFLSFTSSTTKVSRYLNFATTTRLRYPDAPANSYAITLPSTLPATPVILNARGSGSYVFTEPLLGMFGTGPTGDVTIAGTVTLTNDVFYNNLTISGTNNIATAGFRIFVKGKLTFDTITSTTGAIRHNGGNSSGSTAGTAAAAGVFTISGAGSTGGAGGTTTGSQAVAPTSVTNGVGGAGGLGAAGSAGTSGAGGSARAGGVITNERTYSMMDSGVYVTNATRPSGGAGGAGGGGGGGNGSAGGAGGGGAGGGGVVVVFANVVEFIGSHTVPLVCALGGNGGNGTNSPAANRGAGGGGGGGGGGFVLFVCRDIIGTPPTDWISVNGGTGGNGGNGVAPTLGAAGGTGGSGGIYYYVCQMRNVTAGSVHTRVLGTAGSAASGQTGGSGGAGGVQTIGSTY